jgi:thiamine-phosphate diphosphorylase
VIRYAITDGTGRLEGVDTTADIIQVREAQLTARQVAAAARHLLTRTNARVLINDRADVAIAAGAHGVHLKSGSPPADLFRSIAPPGFIVSVACHSVEDVRRAADQGADYAVLAPIFPPRSKSDPRPPLGLEAIREAAGFGIPVFALGGITEENAPQCTAAGAAGVAGITLFRNGPRHVLDEAIWRYYDLGYEQNRLRDEAGEIERLRTEDILCRWLPSPPAVICDVGGAAGVYAFPLAEKGYSVHLTDPVLLHIQQARSHAKETGTPPASITEGDARALSFPDAFADAVLLLGPLYHLVEKADRLTALREALRVLKPGGILFAAAISRYASLMDGLRTGAFKDEQFRQIVRTDLSSGRHRNPTNSPEYFTTAYFHRPEELYSEIEEAGFQEIRLLGIEGPAWAAAHCNSAVRDPAQRRALLEMLAGIEEEPSIAGASAHFVAMARKA